MKAESRRPELLRNRVLVFLAVLIEATIPLEHFRISVDDPVERHADFPWPREYARVLHRRFVLEVIAIDRRVALADVQVFRMDVAGFVDPRSCVQLPYVYY